MPWRLLNLGETYTRELDAAVTALGGSTPLLDVKVPVLATGGPDNADLVGDRVVPEHACVSLRIFYPILLPADRRSRKFEVRVRKSRQVLFSGGGTHGWRRL